jgi:predicted Kef-type K+ transport protein
MDVFALYLGAAVAAGTIAVLGGFDAPELEGLETLADLGVALLLFGIGLKLDVRSLARREIWLTTAVHMALTAAVAIGFVGLLAVVGFAMIAGESLATVALVGFALSFSSTVFVVKVLEERSDTTSLYGRIAVGVLIMQDLAAVAFLMLAKGEPPSPWALALVLLVPGAWVLHRAWDRLGHGELQALFGVTAALVLGYWLFELVGVSGDVGALVMGVLLAPHAHSSDLSRSLLTLKDLLLVAFFLQIGMHGTPTLEHVAIAALLLLLLPFKVALYAVLLWLMRLRRRTSFLAGIVLGNYSEFGIIVAAVSADVGMLDDGWVTVVALAVAASFFASAAVNRRGAELASWLSRMLPARDSARLHPDDRIVDVGRAGALVLGLGRVGSTTYERLRDEYGLSVVGVEHDQTRIAALEARGFQVVRADATDVEFWARVRRAGHVKVAVLAMPFHRANLIALARLQAAGFEGRVAAIARYDDDVEELRRNGADAVFHLYGAAGAELADQAAEVLMAGR